MSETTEIVLTPVYEMGTRMLAEAIAKHGIDTSFHWRIGPRVARAIFSSGVSCPPPSREEMARLRARKGDMEFCGLPAFLDQRAGAEMSLEVTVSTETLADQDI